MKLDYNPTNGARREVMLVFIEVIQQNGSYPITINSDHIVSVCRTPETGLAFIQLDVDNSSVLIDTINSYEAVIRALGTVIVTGVPFL